MASTGTASTATAEPRAGSHIHPDVRGLLDQIAVELAEEYVRLMEAAADAEAPHHEPDCRPQEDETR